MGRKPTVNLNLPKGMRRRRRGDRVYYYLDIGERPRRELALGSDYPLAVKKWAELQLEKVPRNARPTFCDAATRYLAEVVPTKAPKTQDENIRQMETLQEFFGNPPAPLDDIWPVHIQQFLEWRKDVPVAANREKSLFSHVWNMARVWGYTNQPNPCTGVKGASETGRDIYVEREVFQAVYDEACQPLRFLMQLLYLTGQRPTDVVTRELKRHLATRTDGKQELIFKQGKTSKKLRVLVIGELLVVVEMVLIWKEGRPNSSPYLLVNEQGRRLSRSSLVRWFRDARLAAREKHPELDEEIAQFQLRDLRAKAGTDKADLAGDVRQAQRQLGHSSVTMTETYIRNRKGDTITPTR
ncbi:tyrosine-type recombinase/integrase [Chromobacterium piscinae]|uniref:tyrosine-type recombinase/integrase n=1 Tax=Chromobacterium piscinae TaxID=686831 RepID=UPI001E4D391F|nr:tyrosine-type recombinase/integrase [Chromobacterium piscinae]MCD5326788.1 tyrosine-type recombinase/integrase [Chromobacterium piscinae]